ncbi:hypothetical protein BDV23DRAFT_167845 [Aspergillus alliaceus]|uniref:Uncharacterized protein n=1 Tax=Petromyces alliaceus TaxID=209559 RepID=A0A5N7BQQ5_PETAA|nr:hypothetical protein BDV23DRAFT_167845 [Aspergillus alliaceus]
MWRYTTMEWKTFDRQGNHVELSSFAIKQPAQYNVLILHPVDGPEKLVSCYFPFGTTYGTYLIGWHGVKNGWDPTTCAVRKFRSNIEEVQYEPEAWEAFETLVKRRAVQSKQSNTQPQVEMQTPRTGAKRRRSLPGQTQVQRPEMRPQRKSLPGPVAANNLSAPEAGETESSSSNEESEEDDESSDEEENEEDEDEDEEEEEEEEEQQQQEQEQEPASKRPRVTEPIAATPKESKVIFKLVSYKSGAIRRFPLEECKTGKEFFNKARTFFQLFDRNAEVKILSCQIASQRVQQFIFEGSEGEFTLLVEQVKSLKDTSGVLTVEVGHVLGLQ